MRSTVHKDLGTRKHLMALSPSAMTWKSRDTNHRRKCKNLLSLHQHFVWHTHFSDTAGKYSPAIPASPLAWKSNIVSQLGKLFLNTYFFKKKKTINTKLREIIFLMNSISRLGLHHQAPAWQVAQLSLEDATFFQKNCVLWPKPCLSFLADSSGTLLFSQEGPKELFRT